MTMNDDFTPLIRLVDDDDAFRESHEMLLEIEGFEAVSYPSAEQFLEEDPAERPGCLLLDIRMPGLSGPELQEELIRRKSRLPVIILTGHADVQTAVRTLKCGAFDYIEKQADTDLLMAAVRRACDASVSDAKDLAADASMADVYRSLTPREQDVLELFARGLQIKEAAQMLGLSPTTVKMHRQNAFAKIGARTSLEAYQWLQEVPDEIRSARSRS